MKRNILLLAALSCLAMTSCSDDSDDNKTYPIPTYMNGVWALKSLTYIENNQMNTIPVSPSDSIYNEVTIQGNSFKMTVNTADTTSYTGFIFRSKDGTVNISARKGVLEELHLYDSHMFIEAAFSNPYFRDAYNNKEYMYLPIENYYYLADQNQTRSGVYERKGK